MANINRKIAASVGAICYNCSAYLGPATTEKRLCNACLFPPTAFSLKEPIATVTKVPGFETKESAGIEYKPICPLCAKRLGYHELAIANHIRSAHAPLPQGIINKLYKYSRASFALMQQIESNKELAGEEEK